MNKIKLTLVGIIIILLISTTLAELFDSDDYRTTNPQNSGVVLPSIEEVYLDSIQPETLDDAVAEIEKMIEDGEPRWKVAKRAATIADVQITNMNDIGGDTQTWHWIIAGVASIFYTIPSDSSLWTEDERKFFQWRETGGDTEQYDYVAKWVWENRVGQCSENADLVYYLLKEAGVEDIRIHSSNRAKHRLVLWGMGNRDPSKPESWTDEVIIPDSWQHYVLRGKAAFNNRYAGCAYNTDGTYPGKDNRTCGYRSRPCCKEINPCRFSALVCLNDTCYGCGYENMSCCKDEKCNEGLECNKDGKCVKKEKDTSAGEFDCPIPEGAKQKVYAGFGGDSAVTEEYWEMPDGKRVGPYQSWWYDRKLGKKRIFACYNAEGKLHGVDKAWNADGTVLWDYIWENGYRVD